MLSSNSKTEFAAALFPAPADLFLPDNPTIKQKIRFPKPIFPAKPLANPPIMLTLRGRRQPTIVGNTPEPSADLPTIVGNIPKPSADLPTIVGSIPKPSADLPTIVGSIPEPSAGLPTIVG